jgi:hypothetical protein
MNDCDKCRNFEPKETRKLTGYICRECNGPCVYAQMVEPEHRPTGCPSFYGPHQTKWIPFYGKVVE